MYQWSLITSDTVILSYIKGYKISFARPVYQSGELVEQKYSDLEHKHFFQSINDLLSIGAISKCSPCEGQFVSGIFLVPKPNGKYRFILNLKKLNKFIDTNHFKLEDLRTALKLITKDCFMGTVDIKDAYFLIKIHASSKKYLRFFYKGNLYEFNVLPFGLNTAPYIFTKIMKPVISVLRCLGYLSTIYLDDYLAIGKTYQECLNNIDTTKTFLRSLGFIINEDKSCNSPTQVCKFLGFLIDSKNFQLMLPNEKVIRIKSEINKFRSLRTCRIREFASFVGLLVSACPAIEYGWLYTKSFERLKFLNLKRSNDDFEKFMDIPSSLDSDLDWWDKAIVFPTCKIKVDTFCIEIFSDASTTGWGISCGSKKASGLWNDDERKLHINYLEIKAAFFGLKIFASQLQNCQILLRIDNTTAISYINRMGGIQFPHLTDITRQIWQWCENRKVHVFASYIRSCDNVIADAESRRNHPDIEWELAPYAFDKIVSVFGLPDIDIFASRLNNKCSKYISWHRDPDAFAINCFTLDWSSFYFYAFPPFSMILKALQKILYEGSKGIMVVPLWPTQPWYPLYQSMLISEVITFRANDDLIISHTYSQQSIHKKITLVAGVLSGRRC